MSWKLSSNDHMKNYAKSIRGLWKIIENHQYTSFSKFSSLKCHYVYFNLANWNAFEVWTPSQFSPLSQTYHIPPPPQASLLFPPPSPTPITINALHVPTFTSTFPKAVTTYTKIKCKSPGHWCHHCPNNNMTLEQSQQPHAIGLGLT